jgi:hypothetical protein
MCPAIEIAFNWRIVESPHRLRVQQARHGWLVNFAIVIPSAVQIYEHISVLLVVTDSLNEAASRDRVALEGRNGHAVRKRPPLRVELARAFSYRNT